MNNGGRILLLGSAVVLLIVGVVCLKRRLGEEDVPTTFLPSGGQSQTSPEDRRIQQPTIIPADPSSDAGAGAHSPWRDAEGSPIGNADGALSPTFPVDTLLRPTTNPLPEESRPPDALDGGLGESAFHENLGADSRSPEPSAPLQPALPLTVITKKDDSLWSISERAYGQGIYYRALFSHNRDRIARPDRIPEGVELHLPPIEELRRLYPDLCPAR